MRSLRTLDRAWRRPLRFLTVGCSNAALSLVVFLALVSWGVLPGGAASAQAAAWCAGVAWSWSWNRQWTFAGRDARGTLAPFAALQAALGVLTAAAVGTLVDGFGAAPVPAWLAVAVAATAANFLLADRWVFRRPAAA